MLEPVRTSVTVVEKIAAEAPGAVTTIGRETILGLAGVSLDDRLRMTPGFSLFRRTSSLTAHPTTQGVSLRGIGSTGASRTLVLHDGIPMNDPFGGWVYWTRFAPEETERVEVSRGASTSVFGDKAMGGAIALFSREPERLRFGAGYEIGNRATHQLSGSASHLWSRIGGSAHGRAFHTDGFHIVPERRRGPIDERAAVRFVSATGRVDFLGAADRLFLRADVLAEERNNGTVLQRNSTSLGEIAAHYRHDARGSAVALLAYHTRVEFRSTFSAIAADRTTERLTSSQRAPAEGTGGAAMWRKTWSRVNVLAGADVQRVEGYSAETPPGGAARVGGGIQWQHGQFAQTDFTLGAAKLFLGARHHRTDGRSFASPSAGVTAGRGWLRARASVYRAFRAPTLNELYREFRAGNAVTQANAALRPEKLMGAEAGFDIVHEQARIGVTLFRNSLSDLITNVTLSSLPNQVTRQRRNAADAVARGLEFDVRRQWRHWRGELAYLFADSRFANGLRIPQTPRHHGSAQAVYLRGGTTLAAGVRSYSNQFEDDRNARELLLGGFAVAHITARQRLGRNLAAVLAIENVLDREYATGLTPAAPLAPLASIGPPRLWRAGLRWER